ncbi:MAG: SDR family NAD(P)-dependent oxidoreductase [Actinomycetota bacterium]|nr:SDR family NAD(P)-dependent oxidoreductase [Actinomycetota bacterium]MDA3020233.1 SDR family NAD(P)-dependent oxidoreductase [Actinomycetota bacterium]
MTSSLLQRKGLVTGAANGLGYAVAKSLAKAGASVSVCDKDSQVIEVAEELRQWSELVYAEVADVSQPVQIKSFVDNAARAMGGIDIVVSNAGIVRPTQPAKDSYERALQDFEDLISVNLRGVYLTGRAAIPHMLATGGDIVNITTDHIHTCGWPEHLDHADAQECPWKDVQRAPVGSKNFDIYDSSKWGIKGITNAWSRALAPQKIRVNSFGMGATITPMFMSVLGNRPLPPGTMQADDVASLIVELIAEGPEGRTGDDVQVWAGHPTVLPPIGLEGRLAMADLA